MCGVICLGPHIYKLFVIQKFEAVTIRSTHQASLNMVH